MKIQDSILAELDVHDYRTEQQLFDWCNCSILSFRTAMSILQAQKKIYFENGKWYHWKRKELLS